MLSLAFITEKKKKKMELEKVSEYGLELHTTPTKKKMNSTEKKRKVVL